MDELWQVAGSLDEPVSRRSENKRFYVALALIWLEST